MGMTAPILAQKKFWIVKPAAGRNEIWNPRFDPPEGIAYWNGGPYTIISLSGDETRRNAYSLKALPMDDNVAVHAYYNRGLKVRNGLKYTFSCDIKAEAGQSMRLEITNQSFVSKAQKYLPLQDIGKGSKLLY